ncbi:hypothetical protein [Candidatus Poriferisodalis sp.]|uniref:hypothetical protein n=1 Tax=Candidatus Poriferisodalis sp. TaxID=3101277 RepID=UPI003B51E776
MSSQHDGLSKFRAAYLDYLEGIGDQAPSLDDLNDTERKTAEAFIESTQDAAGINPYASRPSIEQLLDRIYSESFLAGGEYRVSPTKPATRIGDLRAKQLQESFPLKEAIERGWIPDADAETTEAAIREFFGITNENVPPLIPYAARRLSQSDDSEPKQQAWLARVRRIASAQEVEEFDLQKLADIARRLPRVLRHGPRSVPRAVELLATCGVRVVFCRELRNTRLAGATTFLPDGRPVIGLTACRDRFDSVVFTLLHECAHLTRGHITAESASSILDDIQDTQRTINPTEAEANEQVSKWLFPDGFDTEEVRQDIEVAAQKFLVHPSCVAGRIQHDAKKTWTILTEHICPTRSDLLAAGLLVD